MKISLKHLLTVLLIAIFLSCGNNKKGELSTTESSITTENDTDVELLKEYLTKENQNITDNDGFKLNYKVDKSLGKIVDLGTSDTLTNSGTYKNSMFLNLSIRECIFALSLNGEHKKDVKLVAQVFSLYELNPAGSDNIPKEYTLKENYYLPQIDDESIRKKIIEDVTTPSFSQTGFVKNSEDTMLSDKWINMTTTLIKTTKILDYKTVSNM